MKCVVCLKSNWSGLCWHCCKKYLPACYRRSASHGYRLNEYEAVDGATLWIDGKKYILEGMPPYVQYTNQSQEEFITQVTLTEARQAFEAPYRYRMIELARARKYIQIAEINNYVSGQEYTATHRVLQYLRGRQKNIKSPCIANLSKPPGHWKFGYDTWKDYIVEVARGIDMEMQMVKI